MPSGEFVSRTGFKVTFKRMRFFKGFKGDVRFKLPRRILLRMKTPIPRIMVRETTLQVGCRADVTLRGGADGAKNVGVEHGESIAKTSAT